MRAASIPHAGRLTERGAGRGALRSLIAPYNRSFRRNWSMTCTKRSPAVVSAVFAVLLSLSVEMVHARDADLASRTVAAAQAAKRKCINACRARYRDCRRLSQAPSFQCRDVYQDCTRYSCTGLGPG